MRREYKEFLDTVDEATESLINNAITIEGLELDISGFSIDSADSFKQYRDKLIDAVWNSEDIEQARKDGKITMSGIELLVDDSMAKQFPKYYEEFVKQAEKQSKVETIKAKFKFEPDIDKKIENLTAEEFDIACDLVAGDVDYGSFEALMADVNAKLNPFDYFDYDDALTEYKKYQKLINSTDYGTNGGTPKSKYGNVDFGLRNKYSDVGYLYNNYTSYDNGNETKHYALADNKDTFDFATTRLANINDAWFIMSDVIETSNGAARVQLDVLDEYVKQLMALAGDNWTAEDLMRLDAEGI